MKVRFANWVIRCIYRMDSKMDRWSMKDPETCPFRYACGNAYLKERFKNVYSGSSK